MRAEDLYEGYLDQVYRFSAMVTADPDATEALAQDVMLRALHALHRFNPQHSFIKRRVWRIAVDAARDRRLIQQRRRLTFERLPSLRGREPDLDPKLLAAIPDKELLSAIHRLPRRARAVIALRFGAELDFATIADALEISPSVARSTCSRGLAKLDATLSRT